MAKPENTRTRARRFMAGGSPVVKPSLNDSGTFFDANAASRNPQLSGISRLTLFSR
jgi:hypothetical protein